MRQVAIRFDSGKEFLADYVRTGSHGELSVRDAALGDVEEGEHLLLLIEIESVRRTFRVWPQVVEKTDDGVRVSFDRDDQAALVNSAWADAHQVPQRKYRRFAFETDVALDADGETTKGRVLDVSTGGCRVCTELPFAIGRKIRLQLNQLSLAGWVRWATPGNEMGIEFSRPASELLGLPI